jgi:putative Holliday junction resolvase
MNNQVSESEGAIRIFIEELKLAIPEISIERQDERFTSKIAMQSMIDGGLKKKKRQDKARLDEISATLILQSYIASNS